VNGQPKTRTLPEPADGSKVRHVVNFGEDEELVGLATVVDLPQTEAGWDELKRLIERWRMHLPPDSQSS
jgi:hypothetical protein